MSAAAARSAAQRIGRRGAVLILLGGIAALYGYSLIVQPVVDQRGLRLLLGLMPLHCWAALMLAAGVLAVGCSPLRHGRDWPGFTVLVMVWTPWSLSFLVAWLAGEQPRGWVSCLIFAAFAGIPAVAVGWPEAPHVPD